MHQADLFSPMLTMMILTAIVWVYMYAKRIPFLSSLDLDPNDITPALLTEVSPPSVANPSDNLKNLFEMPVLFYALVLYLTATGQADGLYAGAAWAFVVLRALHSMVHCTVNIVMLRFAIYAASSLALFFMLARAAAAHFA